MMTNLWNWHSPAWVVAIAAIALYGRVVWRRHATPLDIAFFATAVIAFLIALASPLATLAKQYLFSAHMAQHLLLLLIVPLCALLAWPTSAKKVAATETPHRATISIGWMAGVGAMWFWHIPALCTASMQSPVVFGIQIVSLIGAGAAFWWPVFNPVIQRRMPPHLATGYLFAGCVGCSLLGIYVTFSPIAVCPLYCTPTGSAEILNLVHQQWGITCRADQQIGGLLMWVPACMVYLSAVLVNLHKWYHLPNDIQPASTSLV